MADIELIDRLPVLNVRDLEADPDRFRQDFRRAARDVGFFYLVGHGIDPEIIRAAQQQARAFFALPEAEKLAIQMVRSPHFRGYNLAGQELTRGRRDWREQVDIGPEREAVLQEPGVPPWTRLQGPNQWPLALPSLRPALTAYTDATTALAIRLLRAFAEALGQPPDALAPIHTPSPHWLLKIIRYPGREATEDDQGVGAHKDGGFLTLLLQDDIRGLQVETGDGRWIDVAPLPGSFVVNIGELLELASDGYLRATVHRAVTPPSGTDRLSIGYFFGANLNATVPQLSLPPDLAAERRGVTGDPDNPLLRDTGLNALKGRLRSHPDVAARHHADLVAGATP